MAKAKKVKDPVKVASPKNPPYEAQAAGKKGKKK